MKLDRLAPTAALRAHEPGAQSRHAVESLVQRIGQVEVVDPDRSPTPENSRRQEIARNPATPHTVRQLIREILRLGPQAWRLVKPKSTGRPRHPIDEQA